MHQSIKPFKEVKFMKTVIEESCGNKKALEGLINMSLADSITNPDKEALIN